jgi:hypothetical protein
LASIPSPETSLTSLRNPSSSDSGFGNPFEDSFLEFYTRDIVEDPKPEEKDLRERKYSCEICGKSFDATKYLVCHNQLYHGKSLFEMLLESMKPQKTFYLPSVPSSLNVKAWQKYEEIFGDHDCNECEVKAVEDNETGNMINLKL